MHFRHQVNCHHSRSLLSPTPKTFCLVGSLCGTLKNEIPVINAKFEERQVTLFFKVSEETAAIMKKKILLSPKSQMQRVCSSQLLVLVSHISQLAVLLCGGREDTLKFWKQQGWLFTVARYQPGTCCKRLWKADKNGKRSKCIHLGFQNISLLHLRT